MLVKQISFFRAKNSQIGKSNFNVKISRLVYLLCPWGRYLTGLSLSLSGRLVVTGENLTRKSKRSLRCLLVELSWQKKSQKQEKEE